MKMRIVVSDSGQEAQIARRFLQNGRRDCGTLIHATE